mmetsp:Transcript_23473/g.20565  ORF Transcript_23473/g.20565 Transcript_23473/m.20565 type:complete len:109 (+) Transcript_23473:112-438(+)
MKVTKFILLLFFLIIALTKTDEIYDYDKNTCIDPNDDENGCYGKSIDCMTENQVLDWASCKSFCRAGAKIASKTDEYCVQGRAVNACMYFFGMEFGCHEEWRYICCYC